MNPLPFPLKRRGLGVGTNLRRFRRSCTSSVILLGGKISVAAQQFNHCATLKSNLKHASYKIDEVVITKRIDPAEKKIQANYHACSNSEIFLCS